MLHIHLCFVSLHLAQFFMPANFKKINKNDFLKFKLGLITMSELIPSH